MIMAILAAASLITPALAQESELKFHGTITFNRRVVGCDTIAYAKRPDIYQLLAEPVYQPAVQPFVDRCQVLSAWREWGVYKVDDLIVGRGPGKGEWLKNRQQDQKQPTYYKSTGYAVCLVSMFIRQDPTSCLWVVPLGDWIASQTYAD